MNGMMQRLSDGMDRLEDRVRHLELRQALLVRDLREMRKAGRVKPGVDWKDTLATLQASWLVRLALLFALLAFNWKLDDAIRVLAP